MASPPPSGGVGNAVHDLSASIDTLPPRRPQAGQDAIDSVFGFSGALGGLSGKPGYGGVGPLGLGGHGRQKSKTDFLDLADSTTRLGTSPELSSRLEQKRFEHERQRTEQKRVFEAQMKALQEQQAVEEREILGTGGVATSAPVTPPRDGVPSKAPISKSDSVPGRSRSGNDLAGFSTAFVMTSSAHHGNGIVSAGAGGVVGPGATFREYANNSKSVPGSRRHSGEAREDDSLGFDRLSLKAEPADIGPFGSKFAARQPAHKQAATTEAPSVTSFLFDDEDADLHAFGGKYLQMNTDDDKFPILVRRDSFPGMLSASSAALDLASPIHQTPPRAGGFARSGINARAHEWSPFAPTGGATAPGTTNGTPNLGGPERSRTVSSTSGNYSVPDPRGSPISERGASPRLTRSVNFGTAGAGRRPSASPAVNTSPVQEKKPAVPAFFSSGNPMPPPNGPADFGGPHFPPVDFVPGRQGGGLDNPQFGYDQGFGPYANGAFGSAFENEAYRGVPERGNGQYGGGKRRDPESNRFANIRLEDMVGDMFGLCKDQHGCRFLQKKLEEGDPTHRDMIFHEISPRFAELMTDAFGNYLSQKLLEYCTDDQRDVLIESIGNELVSISLNMHGTRAVQKMIDYLSTERQVQALIAALNLSVVALIKDLNGNHVIQKCLNHLPPEQNQWIFNQVASNCVEVATHRHGCCVLQRCIDHASESQRIQLVTEITYNSLTLVQDPFGNYVVQYVLDLNDSRFIEAIVRQFMGNVCALSMQKFSSNVVEKCIRVADQSGRRALIGEFCAKPALERLLRDSFGNYCAQTALDYAEPGQRAQLVEMIRPILPMIRNTPYGKRIQSKIQRDGADPRRGAPFHPALVPGGYFLAPPHLQGHPQHPIPLLDGRTGAPLFNPAMLSGVPGQMPGFAPPPPGPWSNTPGHAGHGVPVNFGASAGEHSQQASPFPPFM